MWVPVHGWDIVPEIGLSADVVLWREFLQGLVARGVRAVKLVSSDAHPGLKSEISLHKLFMQPEEEGPAQLEAKTA